MRILSLCCLVLPPIAAASAADLNGSWKIVSSQRYFGPATSYLTLSRSGTALAAVDPCMSAVSGSGTVSGGRVSLRLDDGRDGGGTRFEGRVAGGGMAGVWSGGDGSWDRGGWVGVPLSAAPTAGQCVATTLVVAEGYTCTWGTDIPSVPEVQIAFEAEPGTVASVTLAGDKVSGEATAAADPARPWQWRVGAGIDEVDYSAFGSYSLTLHFADGTAATLEAKADQGWACATGGIK